MSMLDVLEKEIHKLNIYEGNIPNIVEAIANSIPSQTIPRRMKLALAVSELVLFASQFRNNIQHWNGSIIPVNSIMFCVAKSGASKDSSVKAARKCFEEGYEIINQVRHDNAVDRAIQKATQEGYDLPDKFASYKDFYNPPNPLFVAISTSEGFIQHLNDLSDDAVGSGFIYSGEVGAELASNLNLVENLKVLAELYDEGTKEVKVLKSRENQSREVKNLPVNALFIGSQDNLLYDDNVKRKFKTEFTSKLARRSIFVFVNEDIIQTSYNSVMDMIREERKIEDSAIQSRKQVSEYITELTASILGEPMLLLVEESVRDLFALYKRYNEELAATIDNQYPIAKLTRAHLQWKALKISGAFAIIEGEPTIQEHHYKGAMEFLELINNDIALFEKELVKEPYELFADYCRYYAVDGKYSINLHTLRKLGFISMKGQSANNLKELIKLVSSYDESGIYELKNDIVSFREIEKTDTILLSYVPCSGSKEARRTKCDDGYICEEVTFKDIQDMLEGDFAYCPFRFKNGKRGADNIDSTCKWIVLDIDSSEITDDEAHILLSDINHYTARTSDNSNPHKFRVILELEAEVDIPNNQWSQFTQIIAQDLGLIRDPLSKSQIYYSYSDRKILSQLEASPLPIKPYLDALTSLQVAQELKKPSKKECSNLLDDPITTFEKAFYARDGEGSRKMIWAAKRARELGADKEYVIELMHKINNYWTKPLEEQRFNHTILQQISRWTFD